MAPRQGWFARFFGGRQQDETAQQSPLQAKKPQDNAAVGEAEGKPGGPRVPPRRLEPTPVGCGCCGPIPGVRLIEVRGDQVGLLGLDEILAEVRRLGLEDEERIKDELLARVKQRNYVTPGYEPAYREALWREYRSRRSAS